MTVSVAEEAQTARFDGGAAVVETLRAAGADTIFLLHGGHIDPIILAAQAAGIRLIDTRHEAVTGYAADAYTRMTGKIGISLSTAGPGFTNVLTAITSAWLDRIPVLFISGAPPLRDIETNVLQGNLDQVAMAAPVTKWAGRATSAETAVRLTAHAIRTAQAGVPGPVFLELPIDVLFDDAPQNARQQAPIARPAAPAPDAGAIASAVEILASAKRPVIMAGTGIVISGAGEALGRFAQQANIPVFTNVKAAGAMGRNHPMACGTFSDISRSGLAPDAVLLIGARIGMYTGGATGVIPASAQLIQVDLDAREMGRERDADVGIVADCGATIEALAGAHIDWPARNAFLGEAKKARGWIANRFGNLAEGADAPIHPFQAVSRLREIVSADDVLVISDGGDTSGWCEIGLSDLAGSPGSYASVGYLGNLGMHQGWAIAAQIAHPDKRIVCVTGDGSLGFQIMEFDTYLRHGLPIVTVVLNNACWGMSISGQHAMWKGKDINVRLEPTRYDLVAQACGGHGELVTDPADLVPAYERALASGKPACVNVMMATDPQVMSPRTEAMIVAMGGDEVVMPYYANLKK